MGQQQQTGRGAHALLPETASESTQEPAFMWDSADCRGGTQCFGQGNTPRRKPSCTNPQMRRSHHSGRQRNPPRNKVASGVLENGSSEDSFPETSDDKDSASSGDTPAAGADMEESKSADDHQHMPTSPLQAPVEKAIETKPERAEEMAPGEFKEDEDAEEPHLTCCGLCLLCWKSLQASEGCPENILQGTHPLHSSP
ncbi:uncharacterized protein LOC108296931 isoform X5 [Cebus imitator]|uniref:uncharacterized protein LOC108296931 isoform X5 n=1 Tax=Cebus imitator TaxID=2715852 RepID=UPI00080A6301|nr:uncharacterized protein LOC108296931 isoform X5 [Cebus imitator]